MGLRTWDLVVYGATSAGVIAAVVAKREGMAVLLVAPGRRVGGLSAGGLGATDIGNKRAIGGVSREFYRRVRRHYGSDQAWRQERRDTSPTWRDEDAMWRFEPHVAERVFHEMLVEADVPVLLEARLDLHRGANVAGRRIRSIALIERPDVTGRFFIDATYEGDLLAKAGVSYTVGRESCALHGEALNGVQVRRSVKHQFIRNVDPYQVPGDSKSGLIRGIQTGGEQREGAGDKRVQAYNFRMCLTDVRENQVPFEKPDDYDPLDFELLLRNLEAGDHRIPWNSIRMPNRKTDTNNNFAVSTDFIGMSWRWPEAGWKERERIFKHHRLWQQGLVWTLANHPRSPEAVRAKVSRWGLAKDEFVETGSWPHELYVREGRRMVAACVMTESHCLGQRIEKDAVGLAAYNMDSHNVRRYVDANGHVRNEGDIQVPPSQPYPIAFRAIVPRRVECENLLVPVCLSASHMAYGSIRMEPVFMILGHSAAIAVTLARGATPGADLAVQDVVYDALRQRLLAQGQILHWGTAPRVVGVDPAKISGIVVDDEKATLEGAWVHSMSIGPFVHRGYRHDNHTAKGSLTATFKIPVRQRGRYRLLLAYSAHGNRASNVPVRIRTATGPQTVTVDQRRSPEIDSTWTDLGTFDLAPRRATVSISNRGTNGYVIIDAVRVVPAKN
ncbi:MAG: FAD-dependent oxidoreductase [Planctomycetes bacterium]|nr:FAD-dependent oxidoreductase [Planctomycetota bacterium]